MLLEFSSFIETQLWLQQMEDLWEELVISDVLKKIRPSNMIKGWLTETHRPDDFKTFYVPHAIFPLYMAQNTFD